MILNWSYWDGDITHHIFALEGMAESKEIDGSAYKVLSLHKERLKTLRFADAGAPPIERDITSSEHLEKNNR
ncbi:MAG: hypothetical protein E7813_09760 [Bradyrhizobium sp.]|uniref:hypothetical protein n=1 Tax=Bradyrhizobium sp. TaxID=376 RepID=UPI0012005D15|nr:hypothetical protein [Bradyrhizobium sp.]THD68708.1 MAG: hypothetical protein E7813_09760 [Bradyrhizobium sp.]